LSVSLCVFVAPLHPGCAVGGYFATTISHTREKRRSGQGVRLAGLEFRLVSAAEQRFFKKAHRRRQLVWLPATTRSARCRTAKLDANSQTWSDTLGPLARAATLKKDHFGQHFTGNDALMVNPKISIRAAQEQNCGAVQRLAPCWPLLWPKQRKTDVRSICRGRRRRCLHRRQVDAAVLWVAGSQIEKAARTRGAVVHSGHAGTERPCWWRKTERSDKRKGLVA
jgi:hypothetical protein